MTDSRIPDVTDVRSPPRRSLSPADLEITDDHPIGAGGQAVVQDATLSDDTPPDRVALKEPPTKTTLTNEAVESFLEEADTWATVDSREREKPRWNDSEHIVGVIDTGDDQPWIAMEYMDGGDLEERLEANPDGLPLDEALWVGEGICHGIEVAHNYGIAHLDLKPANVLFRATGPDTWDMPKIADWGLARVLAEQTGTMDSLSVRYAAPEQFEPDQFGGPDKLTDIYQVGALLYALLTGDPPYTGSQTSIMFDVVTDDSPVLPSERRPAIPESLDAVMLTALEAKKTDRYRDISALEQALQAVRTDARLPEAVNTLEEATPVTPQAPPDQSDHPDPDTTKDGEDVETGTIPTDESTPKSTPSNNGEEQHPPVTDSNAAPPTDTPSSQTVPEQQAAQDAEQEGNSEQSAATFLLRLVTTILYGISGVILTISPIFLTGGGLPSFATSQKSVATFAMLGGVLLIGGAAGRVAGIQTRVTRGIGAAGVLVFLTGISLVFLIG